MALCTPAKRLGTQGNEKSFFLLQAVVVVRRVQEIVKDPAGALVDLFLRECDIVGAFLQRKLIGLADLRRDVDLCDAVLDRV